MLLSLIIILLAEKVNIRSHPPWTGQMASSTAPAAVAVTCLHQAHYAHAKKLPNIAFSILPYSFVFIQLIMPTKTSIAFF